MRMSLLRVCITVVFLVSSFANGQTAYESVFANNTFTSGGTTYGNAVVGGTATMQFLSLTNAISNQAGAARINITSVMYPTISFRMYIAGGTGGQGVAFSYGDAIPSSINATRTLPWAAGFGNNFIATFRPVGDAANSPGINVFLNGSSGARSFVYTTATVRTGGWNNVTVQFLAPQFNLTVDQPRLDQALMSISYNSVWVVENQTISNWNPVSNWGFMWSASTSSTARDIHRIDTIRVVIQKPPVVTSVVVLYGDSVWPQDLWTGSTLSAAVLCARGPPFSVKIGKITVRVGTPRGRRHLLQTGTSTLTYSIEVNFFDANATSSVDLARNFALNLNNGTFSTLFSLNFATLATITSVSAAIIGKNSYQTVGSIVIIPVPVVSAALFEPEITDYLTVSNVNSSGIPPPAPPVSALTSISNNLIRRRQLRQHNVVPGKASPTEPTQPAPYTLPTDVRESPVHVEATGPATVHDAMRYGVGGSEDVRLRG